MTRKKMCYTFFSFLKHDLETVLVKSVGLGLGLT